MEHELFNVGLPKWPQMLVRGRSVTPEQALEIIRRTDTFFTRGSSGNNKKWNAWVKNTVGMPLNDMDMLRGADITEFDWQSYYERQEAWAESWGSLTTEYVTNSWVSCSFIHGPHGWCHPDGTIAYVDNIGKYPSVEEVFDDWKKIAEAFPFLTLDAVLMSGEECEDDITPVVGFRVRNETVTVLPGDTPDWFAGFDAFPPPRRLEDALTMLLDGHREIGVLPDIIERWAMDQRARNPELYEAKKAASASRSINN